jgi:hypothetical protein
VRERADDFDLLHFHIELFHFPLFRSLEARTLTTLHGRQDLSDLKNFYHCFSKMPLVSISAAQRKPLPHANFVATIHHGIPADLHRPAFGRGSYLAFLGRISPEKRPDRAIRIHCDENGQRLCQGLSQAFEDAHRYRRRVYILAAHTGSQWQGGCHNSRQLRLHLIRADCCAPPERRGLNVSWRLGACLHKQSLPLF